MDITKTLEETVADFFKAFDERDTARISQICSLETVFVHNNGVVTNLSEMVKIIDNTQNWYPRKRELSEFTALLGNPYSIIGLKNIVVFKLPNEKVVEEKYRETWIFKVSSSNDWKPIRVHYSSITQEKHSEEVK
ncbi:MAG: hypothetical protein ACD_22C00226G0003 [uncultured bacterium]|nr:MAG: hypothetical protein ACD_22C00226G0003 [uncultured bacterium]